MSDQKACAMEIYISLSPRIPQAVWFWRLFSTKYHTLTREISTIFDRLGVPKGRRI